MTGSGRIMGGPKASTSATAGSRKCLETATRVRHEPDGGCGRGQGSGGGGGGCCAPHGRQAFGEGCRGRRSTRRGSKAPPVCRGRSHLVGARAARTNDRPTTARRSATRPCCLSLRIFCDRFHRRVESSRRRPGTWSAHRCERMERAPQCAPLRRRGFARRAGQRVRSQSGPLGA